MEFDTSIYFEGSVFGNYTTAFPLPEVVEEVTRILHTGSKSGKEKILTSAQLRRILDNANMHYFLAHIPRSDVEVLSGYGFSSDTLFETLKSVGIKSLFKEYRKYLPESFVTYFYGIASSDLYDYNRRLSAIIIVHVLYMQARIDRYAIK